MYRITCEQGNGYRCGCCRQTWTETIDFDTKEEVIDWLTLLKAQKKNPKAFWTKDSYNDNDGDDRDVEDIREIKDEDVSWELQQEVDDAKVEALIQGRLDAKEKAKKRAERAAATRKVREEKKAYQRLKEKFEPQEEKMLTIS